MSDERTRARRHSEGASIRELKRELEIKRGTLDLRAQNTAPTELAAWRGPRDRELTALQTRWVSSARTRWHRQLLSRFRPQHHSLYMTVRTDEQLLTSGDPEDFAALYRRYERAVLAYFCRSGVSVQEAVDLTAETFVRALARRPLFVNRGAGAAAAWLFGIARNAGRELRARDQREKDLLARLEPSARALESDQVCEIAALKFEDELSDSLRVALLGLSLDQRSAVWARVVEGHDYRDLTSDQATVAAVKQRVSRGLRALKLSMERS